MRAWIDLEREQTYRIVLVLFLALMASRCLHAAWQLSSTYDEGMHLLDGYNWLLDGRVQDESNPPLGKALFALPLLLHQPDRPADVDPQSRHQYIFHRASRFLGTVGDGNTWKQFSGRAVAILLLILCACVTARWTYEFAGRTASAIALLLFTVEPNLLAHGMLTTLDGPATLGVTLTLWLWWRLTRSPTWSRAALCGLALGWTLGAKFSTLILLPLLLLLLWLWIRRLQRAQADESSCSVGQAVLFFVGLLAIAAGVLWMAYGFDIGPIYRVADPSGRGGRSLFYTRVVPLGFLFSRESALYFVNHVPVPAPALWRGIASVLDHVDVGRKTFLCGAVSPEGWRCFYVMVAALKWPLPVWGLALLCVRYVRRGAGGNGVWVPLVGAGCFLVAASLSHFQLGIRHILPVMPCLIVLLALGTARVFEEVPRFRKRLAALLLLLVPIPGLLVHPGYLSFMNLAAGGPAAGYLHLVDSNYDWGQELHLAIEFIRSNPDEPVYTDLFGNFDEASLPANAVPLQEPIASRPTPGLYIVSATCLQGFGTRSPGAHPWLWLRQPDRRLGWTIFVYRVGEHPEG